MADAYDLRRIATLITSAYVSQGKTDPFINFAQRAGGARQDVLRNDRLRLRRHVRVHVLRFEQFHARHTSYASRLSNNAGMTRWQKV